MKNQSGQMIVEMILILTLFFGATAFIAAEFKSNEVIANILSKPWDSIAGLIESGVWVPAKEAREQHPSHNGKHISLKGVPGEK